MFIEIHTVKFLVRRHDILRRFVTDSFR